jgi:phosphoenolpyruvate synthase/pyruvate phosphate dikinase
MYIQPLATLSYKDSTRVGGKAASLGELSQNGVAVPDGFVVTTDAFTTFKDRLSDSFSDALRKAFVSLGAERVAVRSSAVGEDSDEASWAGQLETYLNVTKDDLLQAIQDCWQSATSDRAKSYAKEQGITKDLDVAVVVQHMVDSGVAGVAFSSNPITQNTTEVLIEAVHGLGELLVQGSVIPDNYVAAKQSGKLVDYSPNQQTRKLAYVDGKNKIVNQKPGVRCLSDKQVTELCDQVKKIEKFYGKPQDIEWAFSRGKLYIVQARPITT